MLCDGLIDSTHRVQKMKMVRMAREDIWDILWDDPYTPEDKHGNPKAMKVLVQLIFLL